MRLRQDSERVTVSLKEAITLLCKTGLSYSSQLHIDGLLGITLDNDQVLLVKIQEVIRATSENCEEASTVSGSSPLSRCVSEEPQEEVIDLCVKSNTPPQQADEGAGDGEQAREEASERRGEADDVWLETHGDKPLVMHFESAESQPERGQVQEETDCAEQKNQVAPEPEVKSRRRARKSKTTRHICKQDVEDQSGVSDQEETLYTENSQHSQEAVSISAGVNESSCSSDDAPVNLSAHASPNNGHVDAIVVKEESSCESQNVQSVANELNSAGSINLLNSVTISAEPLPQLNHIVPYNEQELHAQWLSNIAAHVVQNVQHNPLVIATPQVSGAPQFHASRTPSSTTKLGGKNLIPIAPAPDKNAVQLGAHRYSPYIVPPVMGPGSNTTVVLNQPVVKKTKSAPNAVVNSSGNIVPVTSHKNQIVKPPNNGSVDSFSCANCGCTKTTTWRRNDQGQHVCNPCGLYFRLYRSPASNNRRSLKYSATASNKHAATHICANCGTLVTTMWRRNTEGEPVCNACGLYFKLHKVNRPLHMAKTEIHSRRRKPKSPHSLMFPADDASVSGMVKIEGELLPHPVDLSGLGVSASSPGPALSTDSGGVGEGGYEGMESEGGTEGTGESPPAPALAGSPVAL